MIYLVRHGQDYDNLHGVLNGRRNESLTATGQEQARAVGEKLKGKNIQRIYASPLQRAYETAQIISSIIGASDIYQHDLLMERDFGILTGKKVEDIPKYANNLLKTERVTYFLDAQGAESFPQLYKRAASILSWIKKDMHNNENVLIVSHGDMCKMLYGVHHNMSWMDALQMPYVDNASVLELTNLPEIPHQVEL